MVKNKFKTIAIYSSAKDKRTLDIARHCHEVLTNKGVKVVFTSNFKNKLSSKNPIVWQDSKVIMHSDLLLSIGGDGTILSSARKFGSKGIPILGVNLGNLGFLSDIAPEDISLSLAQVISGEYIEDSRIFLKAKLKGYAEEKIALNEIVIHSGSIAQLMEYELSIDDEFVYKQKADGIIFATPTGSTAYSLSGGGPIVHPKVKSIIVTPMFPHSLSAGALIVPEECDIKIKILSSKVKLCLDGHNTVSLQKNDLVKLSKNSSTFKLIHPKNHNFYAGCRNKLGWSTSLISK